MSELKSLNTNIYEKYLLFCQEMKWLQLTFPVFLTITLILIANYNYLLFHTFSELFAVFIAIVLCLVAWQTYSFSHNNFIMYLGCGYVWIGILDLLHALTYPGMTISELSSANTASQIWIVTRYLEAILLLTSPYVMDNYFNRVKVFTFYGLLSSGLFLAIITGNFSITYIDGEGLTQFKIYSEYIIIAILIGAGVNLWIKKNAFEKIIFRGIFAAIIITIAAELSFTLYDQPHGMANFVGHILKIFSYWFIYISIVKTTITDRFFVMSKDSRTFDAIPDAVVVFDSDGRIRNLNESAIALSDLSKNELIGLYGHDLYHDKSIEKEDCNICNHIKDERKLSAIEIKLNSDPVHWVDITLSPIASSEDLHGMVQIIRDITKRKITEKNLFDTEQKIVQRTSELNSTLTSMQDVVYKTDIEGRVIWITPSIKEQSGYSVNEILGRNVADFYVQPEVRENFLAELSNNDGKLNNYEVEIKTKKGENLWVSANSHYYYDKDGNIQGVEGSLHDISKLKQAEQELILYRDHLHELLETQTQDLVEECEKSKMAERAMSGFLTNMSHELRTPLHGILSYANFGIKKLDTVSKDKLLQYFTEINGSGQHLLRLLNDLLDLSKLHAGKMIYNYHEYDMQSVVSKVFSELSGLADEKNIHFNLTNKIEPAIVNMDSDKIGQVIRNLLSNALKFSPDNSLIEVTIAHNAEGQVEVSVCDQGVGIPPDEVESIFDAFIQSSSTRTSAGGTGLGLPICKEIIEGGHNGRITAENKKDDGACFIFSIKTND